MPKIAIIGSGSSVIGYLSGLVEQLKSQNLSAQELSKFSVEIFEKLRTPGSGLPYDFSTTSPWHVLNIRSINLGLRKKLGKKRDRVTFLREIKKRATLLTRIALFLWRTG